MIGQVCGIFVGSIVESAAYIALIPGPAKIAPDQ